MNPTKREILEQGTTLQLERGAVLHELAKIPMERGLMSMLRHAVYAYYAPLIEVLDWKYQYIEEREAQDAHDAEAGNVV